MTTALTISAHGRYAEEDLLRMLEAHREAVRAHLAENKLELIDHKIGYYRERLAAR